MSGDYYGQILDPFFCFLTVGRLENQRLVGGREDFEASWDVSYAGYFNGSYLIDIDGRVSTLKNQTEHSE